MPLYLQRQTFVLAVELCTTGQLMTLCSEDHCSWDSYNGRHLCLLKKWYDRGCNNGSHAVVKDQFETKSHCSSRKKISSDTKDSFNVVRFCMHYQKTYFAKIRKAEKVLNIQSLVGKSVGFMPL